jgi:hypothetical protein
VNFNLYDLLRLIARPEPVITAFDPRAVGRAGPAEYFDGEDIGRVGSRAGLIPVRRLPFRMVKIARWVFERLAGCPEQVDWGGRGSPGGYPFDEWLGGGDLASRPGPAAMEVRFVERLRDADITPLADTAVRLL